MMAHFPPAHLLYERRGVGVVTMNIINQILSNNIKEALVPGLLKMAGGGGGGGGGVENRMAGVGKVNRVAGKWGI